MENVHKAIRKLEIDHTNLFDAYEATKKSLLNFDTIKRHIHLPYFLTYNELERVSKKLKEEADFINNFLKMLVLIRDIHRKREREEISTEELESLKTVSTICNLKLKSECNLLSAINDVYDSNFIMQLTQSIEFINLVTSKAPPSC